MSEEDRIDEIIRNAASDYNRPPATPRDEMWTAIQAARQTAVPKLHVAAGGAAKDHIGYVAPKRFGPRFAWMGMAAAAALLIATGVGIGRWTSRATPVAPATAPVRHVADAPAPVPPPVNNEIPSTSAPAAPKSATAPATQPAPQRSREEIRRNPVVVGIRKVRPLNVNQYASNTSGDIRNVTTSNVYRAATIRHLADAEALLTSFSLGSRDAGTNAQFAEWAKGLLSNTRLLLDSPAGDDPRRAKLLQDLETVLAQIVQLSPDARAEDRELVQGSIQDAHVMTRLRTAIPAGQPIENLEKR